MVESYYPNVYFGLFFHQAGKTLTDILGRVRTSELPKFNVQMLKSEMAQVNTPPPRDAYITDLDNFNPDGLPTPRGKFHITTRTIAGAYETDKVEYAEVVVTLKNEEQNEE